jgi:hypothetical protein
MLANFGGAIERAVSLPINVGGPVCSEDFSAVTRRGRDADATFPVDVTFAD